MANAVPTITGPTAAGKVLGLIANFHISTLDILAELIYIYQNYVEIKIMVLDVEYIEGNTTTRLPEITGKLISSYRI